MTTARTLDEALARLADDQLGKPAGAALRLVIDGVRSECNQPQRFSIRAEDLDADALSQLAERHGLMATMSAALRLGFHDHPVQRATQDAQRREAAVLLSRIAVLTDVVQCLTTSDIDVRVVKGAPLSVRLYGDGVARSYGDHDLLIDPADLNHAIRLLHAEGFEGVGDDARIVDWLLRGRRLPPIPELSMVGRDGTWLDIHASLSRRWFSVGIDPWAFPDSVQIGAIEVPVMPIEHEFLYLAVHGARHGWQRLGWVRDIAAITHRCNDLHWDLIVEASKAAGLDRMVAVALRLVDGLFGVAPPPAAGVLLDDAPDAVEELARSALHLMVQPPTSAVQRIPYLLRSKRTIVERIAMIGSLITDYTAEDLALLPTSPDLGPGGEGLPPSLPLLRWSRLLRRYVR